jgi:hypothetical protein
MQSTLRESVIGRVPLDKRERRVGRRLGRGKLCEVVFDVGGAAPFGFKGAGFDFVRFGN